MMGLWTSNAHAWSLTEFVNGIKTNSQDVWNNGNYDVYVPVWTWHNRLFYDKEKYDEYNEMPWGAGFGKGLWKDNDWHGLYFMAFNDSNRRVQTIAGYTYMHNWDIDNDGDFKAGLGYTLLVTQRHEYSYIPIPVPIPLPSVSMSYKNFSVQGSYLPGVKNDGNVLFVVTKWSF